MKPKKRISSAEEIKNDPSIRWNPYRRWEILFSDELGCEVRFIAYDPSGKIEVGDMVALRPLETRLEPLKVRRPVYTRASDEDRKAELERILVSKKLKADASA